MSASSQTRPPEPVLTRLKADMGKLVTRQRLAELDTLRERLPLNDPDRHALDTAADARFAALASGMGGAA